MTEHRIFAHWGLRSIIIGLSAAMTLATLGMGTASASGRSVTYQGFAAQAQRVGLSKIQAEVLQVRVDGYLGTSGGVQVAANEIQYANGSSLVLALPGENRARILRDNPVDGFGCPYTNFCAFQYPEWQGNMILAYYCNTWVSMPWSGAGSWDNYQTWGTQAQFRGPGWNGYNLIYTTGPAHNSKGTYDWTPVWYIDPC